MTVTIDNHTSYSASGFLDTHTIADFECAGANAHLFVGVFYKDLDSITGIQAYANAMTMRSGSQTISNGVCGVEAWEYTLDVSGFNIVASQPSFKELAFTAVALGGVDQVTPTIGTPVLANSFTSTATTSYTGTVGNMLIAIVNVQGTRTLTASGVTLIDTFQPSSGIGACLIGYVEATGVSQTVGATITGGSTNWRISVVEVKAHAAPYNPAFANRRLLTI